MPGFGHYFFMGLAVAFGALLALSIFYFLFAGVTGGASVTVGG